MLMTKHKSASYGYRGDGNPKEPPGIAAGWWWKCECGSVSGGWATNDEAMSNWVAHTKDQPVGTAADRLTVLLNQVQDAMGAEFKADLRRAIWAWGADQRANEAQRQKIADAAWAQYAITQAISHTPPPLPPRQTPE